MVEFAGILDDNVVLEGEVLKVLVDLDGGVLDQRGLEVEYTLSGLDSIYDDEDEEYVMFLSPIEERSHNLII